MGAVTDRAPTVVAFPFVGELVGGSHISACGLIRGLDRSRFTPLVLLQHPDSAVGRLFREAGVDVEQAPASADLAHGRRLGPGPVLSVAARSLHLARFLRERRVGIVHCNDGRSSATWGLAARLSGARLVWHHRSSPDSAGLRLVAPLLADRVIAVSKFAAPRPGRFSAASRATVIHSPFDVAQQHDRAAARTALLDAVPDARNSCFVAFSGVLIDRKRPLLFVEAIAALRRKAPELDVRGVILGEALDDMDAQVRCKAEALGVADAVHLLGFRAPGPFWLAGCDLLMVPAVEEPFGRTLIEAMLVGTPVVATRSGGNVEAIDHERTGLLVPPEDPEALADACLALLLDGGRRAEMASIAQIQARERFGIETHAAGVMAIYDELLQSASGARPVHRSVGRRAA